MPTTVLRSKSEIFLEEHKGDWAELQRLLRGIAPEDIRGLQRLPKLYRRVVADLAQARAMGLAPDILEYLNDLAAAAHHRLYSTGPVSAGAVVPWIKDSLPWVVFRHPWAFLLAAGLFFGSFTLSLFLIWGNPGWAQAVVPAETLEMFEEMYAETTEGGMGLGGAAYYIQHNTSLAFLCFAGGVLFGLGSVYFLLYNGLFLGTVAGYLTAQGYGEAFWRFVTAHSGLELSGIVFAGAAGLVMGHRIVEAGRYNRRDELRRSRDEILTVLAPAVLLLALAAFVEGIISPSGAEMALRISILSVSLGILSLVFLVYPLLRKKTS